MGHAAAWLRSWTRAEVVSASFILSFCVGVSTRTHTYFELNGLSNSIFGLFGINALVLICLFLAIQSMLESRPTQLNGGDVCSCALLVVINAIASPSLTWIGLTIFAMREYAMAGADVCRIRSAVLMLGVVGQFFWCRVIFGVFSEYILKIDAVVVSVITQTPNVGNVVPLPDGSGYLWIGDACSSFGNISLATLCWLMFMQYRGPRSQTVNDYIVCILACVNVVIVNITRISTIAFRPDLYDAIHGPTGAAIAGYVTTLLVVAGCYSGIKVERKLAY